jgi:pilus assembly protein CpaE
MMKHAEPSNDSGGWRALLISPSRGMRNELLPLLAQQLPQMPVLELEAYPARPALAEVFADRAPNLCFLDVSSDSERGLSLIADLLDVDKSMQVIVLMTSKEADLLGFLRMGASEFLLSPFSPEQLQAAIDRMRRFNPQGGLRAKPCTVYCVAPAKGACGASTIAGNLAYQWKRVGAKRILLADLDPLTGIQGFLLKLRSAYSFVDAMSGTVTLDADVWRALVTSSHGVDVLLSPENPVDASHEVRDATTLVDFARQNYEKVVLDTSGAYGDWNLTLARLCDELLLVATNELPALQAAQRVLTYLDRNRVDLSKVRLIINRYNREVGLSREMIETALHTEIYHLIPGDYDAVQKALIEGRPIPPGSGFGKSLIALVNRLAGQDGPPAKEHPSKTERTGGLLSWLLRRSNA